MSIDLLGFVAVVVLAYVIPGPDFIIISRRAAISNREGHMAAAGAQTGLTVHMLVAAAGLSSVLTTTPEALHAIKLLGAAYLMWMGGRALIGSFRPAESEPVAPPEADANPTPGVRHAQSTAFREGFTTNLLNPKAILFFASILPQFIGSDTDVAGQILFLGVLDVAIGVAFWAVLVVVVGSMISAKRRGRQGVWAERLSSFALLGVGIALATASV